MAATRAFVKAVNGDMSRAAELAREALDYLPVGDRMARGVAAGLLGAALRSRGDLAAATQAYAEAVAISQAAGNNHITITVLCSLAALETTQGQLHKAVATCQDAIRLARDYSRQSSLKLPVMGLAYTRLSFVLREWNNLEAALHYARGGLELCKQWGQVDILITGYLNLARVLQAVGDTDGALSATWDAKRFAAKESPPYRAQVAVLEAQLWLAQRDKTTASRWAEDSGLSVDNELSFQYAEEYRVLARVLIAQGKSVVLELLERLLDMTEEAGATGYAIEILVLQAIAFQAQGKSDQAQIALERALSLAQPEDYVRIFIDEGVPMGELLRQATARGIAVDYAGRLLAALEKDTINDFRVTETLPLAMDYPLSERELEVLRLLTTHLSSTEISEELYLSVNTVRFHIKNIYSKLNVHRRTDAVQRAKELGLF
jgi:LuxR family maltose regulon positive regulatory protein